MFLADEPSIELQPVACSWRMSLALNCNQWHVPATTSVLGWDVESRCWRGPPGAAQLFPSCQWFWRLVLSALFWPSCCVESQLWGRCFVVGAGVGASRGVPAFKRAWGRPPGGPEDRPSLQKWTSLLDYQNGPASSTTEMNLWTQNCPRRPTRWTNICDHGLSVPTTWA